MTSAEATTISNAASNALSVANAASQAASVVSVAVDVVSNAVSALTVAHNTLSNVASNEISVRAAASAALETHINTVSNGLSNEISNRISADGVLAAAINVVSNGLSDLVSAHNVLSNRVSANSGTGGAGSVTSSEVAAGDAATSAQAASAINVVSAAVAALGITQMRMLQNDFTVSSSGLVDISGLSVSVDVVSGMYEMNAAVFMKYTSTAAAAVGFGLTFPGMKMAGGEIRAHVSVSAGNVWIGSGVFARAFFLDDASGSIVLSLVPGANASVLRPQPVWYTGTFLVSTAGSLQLQARSSSALTTSAPVVAAGSYVRLIRVNNPV